MISISFIYVFYSTPIFLQLNAEDFPLEKLWSQSLSGAVVDISVSSDNSKIFALTDSALYAILPTNGNIIWSSPLSWQVDRSPALSTTEMVFITDNHSIQALNIYDGSMIWRQPLPESGSGRLVDLSGNLVLVNQTSYDIRAYDTPSGQFLWSVPTGRGFVLAYIDGDRVYIADYGISAVKAATGESIWQHGNTIISTSTYSDRTIYYASENKVTAFDTQTQNDLWSTDLPENGFLRFKLVGDFLFVMDSNAFYIFNKSNGILEWQDNFSYPMNPVIIANNLYIMDGFGRVIRVFNLATKTEVGHIRISAPYLFVAEKQDLYSSTDILFFSIGHEIFAYK